ncbi:hypothetical protein KR51_00011340 [Rubidibacter lacunae KORDI 51-2]|uniref:Glyoxalase/fosfomycin resistance/dioxygenase domain-containing protein n=1 Tax=Rubidibacter lacunae KORDI 51-2 TaxID=582515 RepID=U5DR82_9CHRO|nr:VOC family protein [Rubidibacter lacunae]ERN42205.1 hypothetical protein KR51_00011340 [Rubidibacter lacunae KORDI 51-2]
MLQTARSLASIPFRQTAATPRIEPQLPSAERRSLDAITVLLYYSVIGNRHCRGGANDEPDILRADARIARRRPQERHGILSVPDLDATYRHLSDRGVEFCEPPRAQAWGGTLAHLRDRAGNILTLVA